MNLKGYGKNWHSLQLQCSTDLDPVNTGLKNHGIISVILEIEM